MEQKCSLNSNSILQVASGASVVLVTYVQKLRLVYFREKI